MREVHHHHARKSLRAPHDRSIDRCRRRDGGSARIAVCCPSGHVQTDSSSPFTGDLLLARTCNQGKIVDICRPSAGSGLPEDRRSPLLLLFCVPRVPLIHPATAFAARCTYVRGDPYRSFLLLVLLHARRHRMRARCEIQIYNDVNKRACIYVSMISINFEYPISVFSNRDAKGEKTAKKCTGIIRVRPMLALATRRLQDCATSAK